MKETDDSEKPYQKPVVSLAELLKDGISVAALATAIEKSGINVYDPFGRFLPADESGKEQALQLLKQMALWARDDDYPEEKNEGRSPLEMAEKADSPIYEQYGWLVEHVPNFDDVLIDELVLPIVEKKESTRTITPNFVGCLLITIAEISKRAAEEGVHFDPKKIPATKENFHNVFIKLNENAEYSLKTFDSYIQGICKFRSGQGFDKDFYKKLFPEFFK